MFHIYVNDQELTVTVKELRQLQKSGALIAFIL